MTILNGIQLDAFTLAYVECALWSSTDNADDTGGEPLDRNYCPRDIAPETMQVMAGDCADFQSSFAELLGKSGLSSEQAGHDFWLTRNRHGAGFWDRGLGKVGDELTEMAHPYGSFDLYVGDDGKIYGQ